jgi:hypothetical protein
MNNNFLPYQLKKNAEQNSVLAASLAQIASQFASSPPTTGTWKLADKVWNTNPVSGGVMGWVCIQAGTFGSGNDPVFKEFGIISA